MKWTYETEEQKFERAAKWHKFFIWFPLRDKGTVYWLMTMERRIDPKWIGVKWEYREPLSEFENVMRGDE